MIRNILLALGFFALLTAAVFLYKMYLSDGAPNSVSTQEVDTSEKEPVFTWSFVEADTVNGDGLPETDVYLSAAYAHGPTLRQFVATSPSSCNELPEAEAGSLPNTTNIQCYGAGLGQRFRIVRGQEVYVVQRQIFEEGTPDVTPPVNEYEVVVGFPVVATH